MVPAVAAAGIGAVSDLVGGLADQYFAQKASDKSYKFQKKVLQNQVQWRVADAVKAGLHPLSALGVNPASGPVAGNVGSSLGASLSSMGQNIGRAAEAMLTPMDKIAAKSALLGLEQQQANIDLTRSQLAGAQKALLTQGSTPGIASSIPVARKGDKGGSGSTYGRTGRGVTFTVPPGWTAEAMEDQFGEVMSEIAGLDRAQQSQILSGSMEWINPLDLYRGQSRFPGGRNYR